MLDYLFERVTFYLITRAMLTPYSHLDGYMERYWLVPYTYVPEGGGAGATGCGPVKIYKRPIAWLFQKLGVAVRVHKIKRSDDDRAFHDHPWPYLTVIARGGYVEVRPDVDVSGIYNGEMREWFGPGSFLFRKAKDWHRLELLRDEAVWTIFITGPWTQRWGFMPQPKFNKVYYREYLNGDKE